MTQKHRRRNVFARMENVFARMEIVTRIECHPTEWFEQEFQPVTQLPYVREDNGAFRVGDADLSLDSVVIAFQDGLTPEAIQLQYPVLTLEEVYGAITFYLANQEPVDRYLAQQAQLRADLRQFGERSPSPVVTQLRAMRHAAVEKLA